MEDNNKKKSSEINQNYEFLFEDPETKSLEIGKEINNLMNQGVYIEDLKQMLADKYGEEFFEYSYLNNLIHQLTDRDCRYSKEDVLEAILSVESVVDDVYSFGNETYLLKTKEGSISFTTIDEFVKDKLDGKPKAQYLDEFCDEVSSSETRKNGCHVLSMNGARIFSACLGIESDVVTGYTQYYVPQNSYTHSWIEFEDEGQTKVMDSTMNVVMNKEGYYLLSHMDNERILAKVSAKSLMEDDRKYGDIINRMDLKTYLTSRDEIIRDLDRNSHVFDRSDEGEER